MANATHGKAGYIEQSNALLRKNFTYQRRNKCQNCCHFVTPVLVLILLMVMQNTSIEQQGSQKNQGSPIPNPSEFPVMLRIPEDMSKNSSSSPATFLATGANQSFSQGMIKDMFPTVVSLNSSDLNEDIVLGSNYAKDEKSVSLVYLQSKCNESSNNLSTTMSDSGWKCKQGLTLWKNSSYEINNAIFEGESSDKHSRKRKEFSGAFDFLSSNRSNLNVTLWYPTDDGQPSTSPIWVLGLVNMVTNAYLQYSQGSSTNIVIEFIKDMPTHNYRRPPDFVAPSPMSTLFFVWIVVWLFPVMLQALVYEKQHKLRMMMKMHGLGDGAYWTMSYIYFAIVSYIYILCFVAFGSLLGLDVFTMNNYFVQFPFYLTYINLQVSMAILAAALFSSVKTASVVGYLLVFITGLLGNFLFKGLLEAPSFPWKWVIILELFPGFALYRGVYELQSYASEGSMSSNIVKQWQDIDNTGNGVKEVTNIMFMEWLLSLVFVYYIDQMASSPCWFKKSPTPQSGSQLPSETQKADVVQERETVERLKLGSTEGYAIICDNIRKVYPARDGNPPKVAVKGMSLALPQTGCFGMIGPNAAGKTSFISMMIGLTKPTSGTALINGLDIGTQMHEIHSTIGVCPQHNLLWETLTGREHLLFYGRLKNLWGAALKEAVEKSLKNLNLCYGGVADKQVGKYSVGMKRRLSVAISLIGDPQVVFMDEPSTGMDPASRKQLWKIVKRAKQDRAIVLTTHSMEEGEALCDRLGIFVDGSLQCIADAKELKARYGGSFVLTITTTADHDQEVEGIVGYLATNVRKIYHVAGTQKFELPKQEVRIADVFNAVDIAKSKFPIQAWGLADTTLEDVFIKVAREAQPSI
ncbi:ABC transporter A family member 8-like [Silene latifolia]|uniref:ABC transporter A family member 8-like n=1 Tax=Silene latifolia TaxID=37657 RepID=UPI003D774302